MVLLDVGGRKKKGGKGKKEKKKEKERERKRERERKKRDNVVGDLGGVVNRSSQKEADDLRGWGEEVVR